MKLIRTVRKKLAAPFQVLNNKIDQRFFAGHPFGKFRRWLTYSLLSLLFIGFGLLLTGIFFLPDIEPLINPEVIRPSVVISLDNKELGRYDDPRLPKPVRARDLPVVLKQAVVEMEDPRFYEHAGLRKGFAGTITVRLARLLYDEDEGVSRSIIRKFRELLCAIYLERRMTKDEILANFLNRVEYGGVIQGIENAAQHYFDCKTSALTPHDCALLAGMLRAPTKYHPRLHPETSVERRNVVIERLADRGSITKKDYAKWIHEALVLAPVRPDTLDPGLAPYFLQYLKETLTPWLEENKLKLSTAGLRIFVSLDTRLQKHAEAAVQKHLTQHQKRMDDYISYTRYFRKRKVIIDRAMLQTDRYRRMKAAGLNDAAIRDSFSVKRSMRVFSWNPQGFVDTVISPLDSLKYYARILESGLLTINPNTGHVLAWVGGISYPFFKYDHVIRGKRQVGSTFKPFVYATAFENDYEVCHQILNQPPSITTDEGDQWVPKNADHDYGGMVSLRYGLVHSVNVVTARLCVDVGPAAVVQTAQRMGIQSELKPVPAVSLGTFDLTVAELTTAYAPIVNGGLQPGMQLVLRIEDSKGNIIKQEEVKSSQALKPYTAYTMVELLRGVATNGTAGNVRYIGGLPWNIDLGGKTGTTQNSSDGWYVGFTPHLVTGVWVGCSDRNVNFGHASYGRGSQMAMPIWSYYMASVYKDKKLGYDVKDRIPKPQGYLMQTFCPSDPIKKKGEDEDSDSTAVDSLSLELPEGVLPENETSTEDNDDGFGF